MLEPLKDINSTTSRLFLKQSHSFLLQMRVPICSTNTTARVAAAKMHQLLLIKKFRICPWSATELWITKKRQIHSRDAIKLIQICI